MPAQFLLSSAHLKWFIETQGRLLDQALKELEASESDSAEVMQFVKCIRNSRVGIMRGPVDE